MPVRPESRAPAPRDQADGLRRLFGGERLRFVPMVHNPLVPGAGVVMERVCAAVAEHGLRTLVVDAADTASPPHQLAAVDLSACVESLSPQVSYLAARGLPLRWLDSRATMVGFLDALRQADPQADVVLLAGARPDSLTGAYAAMKQLSQRLGTLSFDLVIASDVGAKRARRMVDRLGECADHFLASALRHTAVVDPLQPVGTALPASLRRLVAAQLQPGPGAAAAPPAIPDVPAVAPPAVAAQRQPAGRLAAGRVN